MVSPESSIPSVVVEGERTHQEHPELSGRVAFLRDAFDRAFASAPRPREPTEDFLRVRVAGVAYGLRVAQIAAVAAGRTIIPLPSRRAALLGLAGIRGNVACVYSLALLLGHGGDGPAPRWLALCGSTEPVAFAFDALEAFMRTPRADVHDEAGAPSGRLVRGVVRSGGVSSALVDFAVATETVKTIREVVG
jgi:chemotaxis signal transduction protein